ncbi:pseudouridine synthase [Celerinatantimonas yamalensis]|uniref:Pseudouridine synthase n=1 Tax=Celerinatantimonas yamalensis TaxID=559956 RepID=A0ABW9G3K2_9GAMM
MATVQRLDKFISHAADLPRSQVKRLLHAGRITVNGTITKQAKLVVDSDDDIRLDKSRLIQARLAYIMLNKPTGYVSTRDDSTYPSALDLIEGHFHPPLHVAGRLDADATGLLFLTNDGQWSHRVTSPNHQHPKTYCVTLAEPLSEQAIQQLEQGVMLHGDERPTLPAQVEQLDALTIRLVIQEGRYHQVKRMLAAVGNKVMQLHREQIGSVRLDEQLNVGTSRELSQIEREHFIG